MSYVNLVNITKYFDNVKVIDNINLNINKGEIISLLGPSGCGKSTTLKLIAGLLQPDSGDILFNNKSVLNIETNKRSAVIVFQEYLLFPHMNIYENIAFGLKMKKVSKEDIDIKVNELLNLIKLNSYKMKYPYELSGGQKQRVAIARALAINPKILLLDEPLSSLDINLRQEMREFILDIQKQKNITTVLVTHDKEEALMMSDKIAVMLDGKIQQFDTPKNLYENPNSKKVANIFGERNYIKGSIQNGIFKSNIIDVDLKCSENKESVELVLSKEDIDIHHINCDKGIKGIIIKKMYLGNRTNYSIKVNDQRLNVISNNNSFNVNDIIKFTINNQNLRYFDIL